MDYFFLDKVPWEQSQTLYHAAAYLQHEALFILRPAEPYVCIGFHQDVEQEIDLNFTRKNNIPVFRREVGGGAVYLDGDQLFYQLVLRKDRRDVPKNIGDLYQQFLAPVVYTYREFGISAEYKWVNDIIANGRKISGNGAAEISGMVVLVGNFIMDFNYEMMSKCLRTPDEKFRDKVYKTLKENLSTFYRETGCIPDTHLLGNALASRYEAVLGLMTVKTNIDLELIEKARELQTEYLRDDWLYANDRRHSDARRVKVREGVYVIQNMLKTPGGLIRATAINEEGRLRDVHLSGDFFFYPSKDLAALERALEGVPAEPESMIEAIEQFYVQRSIESPGVTPENFVEVINPAT